MTSDQPTNIEPAIDHREVARLAMDLYSRSSEYDHFFQALGVAEHALKERNAYLAKHGVTPAEDPRDAEIRELGRDIEVAHRAIVRVSREADEWHSLCEKLQHRIRELQEPPKPAELTRVMRIVRFLRDAEALDIYTSIRAEENYILVAHGDIKITDAEAAAVRAALEDKADG